MLYRGADSRIYDGGVNEDRTEDQDRDPCHPDPDDERGQPGTFVQFINLFLTPAEAEALPWQITFPYGDPFRLDAARTAKGDKYSPIVTACVRFDEGLSGKQLVPAVAWLSSVLGFATRSPAYANFIVDRGPDAGGAWQEST